MFENPRRGRQARNFTTNVPKILDLKSSSEQILSETCRWVPLTILSISRKRYNHAVLPWREGRLNLFFIIQPEFLEFTVRLAPVVHRINLYPADFSISKTNCTGSIVQSTLIDCGLIQKHTIFLFFLVGTLKFS